MRTPTPSEAHRTTSATGPRTGRTTGTGGMMRAVRTVHAGDAGDLDALRLVDLPVPEPAPTEVRVRVHAAGINPVDWKTRAGAGIAGLLGAPPWVLGWDVAGVVDHLGPGVTRFQVGDRVFGMPRFPRHAGGYAAYVTAPSRQLARTPATLDHVHAAGLPLAGLTAWQALIDTADVQPGQRVLIHAAAGGVGHLAVQLARWRGAHVIGTASAPKHDRLRDLGADELIDYTRVRFEDVTGDVDVVVDLVGGEVTVRSLRVLKPGGLLLTVPSGAELPEQPVLDRHRVRATWLLVEPDGHALQRLAALVDDRRLVVHVEATADLADIAGLHRTGQTGRTFGKLVATV